MAVSSRLKTIEGKYYATEEYVDEKIESSIDTTEIANRVIEHSGDQISQAIKEDVLDEVDVKTTELQNDINQKTTELQESIETKTAELENNKANKDEVYTKEEVTQIINDFYKFNTI